MKRCDQLSRRCQSEVGDKRLSVWFDNINQNYIIKLNNQKFYEFETGKAINYQKLKQLIYRVNNNRTEVLDEVRRQKERNIERNKKLHREVARDAAADIYDYALTGKRSIW